ncbi:MAG: tRNA epoxyqueuosine(34) reductase QueG [Anaerolineales bacterium]|nr:tRNA epoxyqueuosine(34) reductase QueG [Anaerolineales bacterium]
MNAKLLRQEIETEASRLGFDLMGVTTPDPPPHLEVYENWLAAGRHGSMDYLATERARQRRADPQLILAECQAILVLGVRYSAPEPISLSDSQPGAEQNSAAGDNFQPTGRMASYAWGDDYHTALSGRLQTLASFIEARMGCSTPCRWYTDTGPLLERDLAQRAGLGWIGKNTCLIHPRRGSYFLLAEILIPAGHLGLQLEPDSPFAHDYCGACTRCIEACPTGCILPDRTLEARRCLSYLTIEHKGPIPRELRPLLGSWTFGCDICQQVCPWNQRFASAQGDPSFSPRPGLLHPNLIEELALSPQDFNQKFKDNPVRRAKRRGYLRNVAVNLGNLRQPAAIPALAKALQQDPEALVRGHAAWALGCFDDPSARQALQLALSIERDEYVLEEIRAALISSKAVAQNGGVI